MWCICVVHFECLCALLGSILLLLLQTWPGETREEVNKMTSICTQGPYKHCSKVLRETYLKAFRAQNQLTVDDDAMFRRIQAYLPAF